MTNRLDPTTSGSDLVRLFCAAQELPEEERRALVGRVSEEDSALADRLRELLAADEDRTAPRLAALCHWLDQQRIIIGEQVGEYRVVECLSRGGMAAVYLAEHRRRPDERVALKVLHPYLTYDRQHAHCLFEEARTARRIDHPGVVEILGAGYLSGGQAYLMMPYLEGESLGQRIRETGRISIERSLFTIVQLLDILIAVHERGIVHRDLKPENIMLVRVRGRREERVTLLDFGIAIHARTAAIGARTKSHPGRSIPPLQPDSRLYECAHSNPLGTPLYMAPEQFTCPSSVDRRADLYSVGCILYTMLCGRPLFMGSMEEIRRGHLQGTPSSPAALGISLDPRLEALLGELLAKKPAARPQSAGEVLERLARIELGGHGRHSDRRSSGSILADSSQGRVIAPGSGLS